MKKIKTKQTQESFKEIHSHALLFAWLLVVILLSMQFVVFGQSQNRPLGHSELINIAKEINQRVYSNPDQKYEYHQISDTFQSQISVIERSSQIYLLEGKYARLLKNVIIKQCNISKCNNANDLTTVQKNILYTFVVNGEKVIDSQFFDTSVNLEIVSKQDFPLDQSNIYINKEDLAYLMISQDKIFAKPRDISKTVQTSGLVTTEEWHNNIYPSSEKNQQLLFPQKTRRYVDEVAFARIEGSNGYSEYSIVRNENNIFKKYFLDSSIKEDANVITYLEARDIANSYIKSNPGFNSFFKLAQVTNVQKMITKDQLKNFDEVTMISPTITNKIIARDSKNSQNKQAYKVHDFNIINGWTPISDDDFNKIKNRVAAKPLPTNFELIGESKIITPPAKSAGSDQYETIISLVHDADGNNIISLPDPNDVSDVTGRDNIIVYGPNNDPQTKTLSFNTKPRPKDCTDPPQIEIIWPIADSEIDRQLNVALKIDESGNIITTQGVQVVAWDDCDQIQYIALYDEKAYTIEKQNYAKEQSEKAKLQGTSSTIPPVPMPSEKGAIHVCSSCSNGQFYNNLGVNKDILYNYNPGDYLTLIVRIVDRQGKESEDRVRLIMSKEIKGTPTQPSLVVAPGPTASSGTTTNQPQSSPSQPSSQPQSSPQVQPSSTGQRLDKSFAPADLLKMDQNKLYYNEDFISIQFGKVVSVNNNKYILTNTYSEIDTSSTTIAYSVSGDKVNSLGSVPAELESERDKFLQEANTILQQLKK